MNHTPYAIIMAMLAVVILASACGSTAPVPSRSGPAADVSVNVIPSDAEPVQDAQPEEAPPAALKQLNAPRSASGQQDGELLTVPVREISVTAKKFDFSPNPITVKQGERVKLKVAVPAGDTEHGFALPDFGVNVKVAAGQSQTVEFTADKSGTFDFFCSVYCGSGHSGMKGQLIVEP